jgi:GT2 family glycosyltransferase
MEKILSIVIPTHNRKDKLMRLIQSVLDSDFPPEKYEIIIVDNNSNDGTFDEVARKFPRVFVIKSEVNTYSGGARNIGLQNAIGKYVYFLDDDNVLDKECLSRLVKVFESYPRFGIVAPMMFYYEEPMKIWCAGGKLSSLAIPWHYLQDQDSTNMKLEPLLTGMDYFPNAYCVRRSIFDKNIIHDVFNFPHNWCEQDFALRVKALGYDAVTVTSAKTYHDLGGTKARRITRTGADTTYDQARSRIIFRKKYFNTVVPWLFFWILWFPASSFYYTLQFAKSKNFMGLLKSYISGTWNGLFIN